MWRPVSDFSLFLMEDGSLLGTGGNEYGQLGLGHENNQTSVQLIMSSGVRHIAAGGRHALIVKTDGSLWGWDEMMMVSLVWGISLTVTSRPGFFLRGGTCGGRCSPYFYY